MRPVTDILREMRRGVVVDQISEELETVIKAVRHTGKGGSLTIKLDIKPRDAEGDQVNIAVAITPKVPQAPLPEAVFFTTIDGDLLRDDPNQREIFTPTDALGDRAERRAAS